jgi:hypothetical protein
MKISSAVLKLLQAHKRTDKRGEGNKSFYANCHVNATTKEGSSKVLVGLVKNGIITREVSRSAKGISVTSAQL